MEIKKKDVEKISFKLETYMKSKLTPQQREALSYLLSQKKSLSEEKNTPDFFKKSIALTTDDLNNFAAAIQNKAAPRSSEWEYTVWQYPFRP